jgi:hypothetical protein
MKPLEKILNPFKSNKELPLALLSVLVTELKAEVSRL